jgi:hypothetical protein
MTRKRFQKLLRSEMTKLMAHKAGAAKCIKHAARNSASAWTNDWEGKSYLEAWTALRSVYTYPGNVPPIK